jgi:hypothetical protein
LHEVDDRLRVRPLADEITHEDYEIIRIDGERIQQRLQSTIAAMNVANDGD